MALSTPRILKPVSDFSLDSLLLSLVRALDIQRTARGRIAILDYSADALRDGSVKEHPPSHQLRQWLSKVRNSDLVIQGEMFLF